MGSKHSRRDIHPGVQHNRCHCSDPALYKQTDKKKKKKKLKSEEVPLRFQYLGKHSSLNWGCSVIFPWEISKTEAPKVEIRHVYGREDLYQ